MANDLAVIEIVKLTKSYSEKLVIDNIDLKIKSGQIFALIGLNGQGKTSLIKSILDLSGFDSGNISMLGIDSLDPISRAKICYLPEKFQPSADLKGIEFIKFSLSLHNTKIDTDLLKILCKELDLDEAFLTKKVTTYSKGMVQKLGLISVFLSNCNLIILDEPMSGLDPKARKNFKNLMVRYIESEEKTIFFTSHILSDIEEICGDIAILHDKKIKYQGDVKDFCAKYEGKSFEDKFLNLINSN